MEQQRLKSGFGSLDFANIRKAALGHLRNSDDSVDVRERDVQFLQVGLVNPDGAILIDRSCSCAKRRNW